MARGAFSGHGAVVEKPITVEGLNELKRAFSNVSKDLGKGVREALDAAGQPVRYTAEQLATSNPSGMQRNKIRWQAMRVGITKTTVYVAPVERGVKSKAREKLRRPEFKTQLLERSLDPALDQNRDRTVAEFADQLAELARAWERV